MRESQEKLDRGEGEEHDVNTGIAYEILKSK